VGAGNVLGDIIKSNTIKTIKLDKIFRQSLGSMIVQNAHKINKGEMPVYNKKDTDFFFIREDKKLMELIVDLYNNRLPSTYGFDPVKDIQILSPMKKGDVGVIEINKALQSAVNPPSKLKKEKTFGQYTFRAGDKVMQIKNNYQIEWKIDNGDGNILKGEGIYNGDIGYVVFIDEIDQELYVDFGYMEPKKETVIPFKIDEIDLIIVPGLVFDKKLNRIGFGKGYYDRILCKKGKHKNDFIHYNWP